MLFEVPSLTGTIRLSFFSSMKFAPLLYFLFFPFGLIAQSGIGFGAGGNIGNVKFREGGKSTEHELRSLPGSVIAISYHLALAGGKTKKGKSAQHIVLDASYKSVSVKDNSSHLLTTWSFGFLSFAPNYQYTLVSKKRVTPFFSGGLAIDYLVNGMQSRGFEQYDLTNEIRRVNVSANVAAGLKYQVSENAHTSLHLGHLRGLRNLETDVNQTAYLHGWQLSAAIVFELHKK